MPIRAIIRLNATKFTPSSTIRVPCEVKGYPPPTITWFKGDYPIEASEKHVIEGKDFEMQMHVLIKVKYSLLSYLQ